MCDPSDEQPGHGDIDHRVGDVDTRFVVSNEPSVAGHPSEGALDDSAAGQDLETGFGAPHDLDAEVEEGGLVEQLPPVVGAIGEQVLDPGPALMNGVENGLGAALSEMSAVVRLTISRRPLVSTAIWRLRPTIFLPPSKPRVPCAAGTLTTGCRSRPRPAARSGPLGRGRSSR